MGSVEACVVVIGGFRFQVGLFFWGGSGAISRALLEIVFQLFQVFSGFFSLVEGFLVGCCSDLFGSVRIGTKRFAGLSRGERGLAGGRGRTGLWLGVGLTLAPSFKRSCVLMVAWLGRDGAAAQGLVWGWPSRAFYVNRPESIVIDNKHGPSEDAQIHIQLVVAAAIRRKRRSSMLLVCRPVGYTPSASAERDSMTLQAVARRPCRD